ncbi:hypothetical protein MHH60_27815 [Paenibacillus sp. FSL H7-0716]
MGDTVKCGMARWLGLWLRVYGSSGVGSCRSAHGGTPCGNLLMLNSMWKFAHGGLHVGICSWLDSIWKSASDGDSIVQLSSVQYE